MGHVDKEGEESGWWDGVCVIFLCDPQFPLPAPVDVASGPQWTPFPALSPNRVPGVLAGVCLSHWK
jgi:hypothetical protein